MSIAEECLDQEDPYSYAEENAWCMTSVNDVDIDFHFVDGSRLNLRVLQDEYKWSVL